MRCGGVACVLGPVACGAVVMGAALGAAPAVAEQPSNSVPDPSIAASLPTPFADPGGVRAALAQRGITYGINYVGEVFGNPSGGFRRGSIYEGLLEVAVDANFETLVGWKGLTFHASGYQIHGEGLTAQYIGNLNPISNIEATPSTRLFDLWFEQSLLDDKLSVRFGQLRVDYGGEFMSVTAGGLYISANFGWASFTGVNLPSGGVTYPLAAPGARVKFDPSDNLTLLFGAYDDDPAGPCEGDPQQCNDHGLDFRLKDEPFLIAEAQFKYNQGKGAAGLPGVVRIGAFKDFGTFEDQHLDDGSLSLADPNSSGTPRPIHADRGIYGIIEQKLANAGGGDDDKGIWFFTRVAGMPSDRNLVDFFAEGGLTFSGLVPGRPHDDVGLAVSYSHISGDAAELDRDTVGFGTATPIRDYETLLELTYKAVIVPGFSLQPDFQYIWHPGGNAPDPNDPAKAIADAAVLGLRNLINY